MPRIAQLLIGLVTVGVVSLAAQTVWVVDHRDGSAVPVQMTSGGAGVPAGAIMLVVSGACPTGYAEEPALNGKFLLGTLDAGADIGTTGGADSITPAGTNSAPTFAGAALGTHSHGTGTYATSAHAGTAVDDHASHTHTYTQVLNHTHTIDVTDPGHNHTQNAHTHVVTSQTATTGSATSYEHGTLDTSSAEAEATEVTGSTTATNIANTTGVTATSQNPAAGVATGTTAGPSAALSHAVTQPAAHTLSGSSEAIGAGTPTGTVTAPTFTGASFNNRPAWVKVIFCRKT